MKLELVNPYLELNDSERETYLAKREKAQIWNERSIHEVEIVMSLVI